MRRAVETIQSRFLKLCLLILCLLVILTAQTPNQQPSIEFTNIPVRDKGGRPTLSTITGRVINGRPGQHIILFAKSGAWYVQPFADQPYTKIAADSTWSNSTHLGTEYAALLAEPDYFPPSILETLPTTGNGIVAVAVVPGGPLFWQTWWFRSLVTLALMTLVLIFFRSRQLRLSKQLNLRFEQRLAERTRIAQDLHDTLLQGLVSASMQLHVANDHIPTDSTAKPIVGRVLELMSQVIEEGRNAVKGLRASSVESYDLEQAFSRIQQELALNEPIDYKIVIEGTPRPLHPIIRDEAYRIGREALVNAFRHSGARRIEVEVEYTGKNLRILVRDNGRGIDQNVLRSGREGHWGMSGRRLTIE